MNQPPFPQLDAPKPSEKIEAILTGAMQEFLTYGYAGARVDRIAATAGVSKATVYSYFQDKESLFVALVQQLAERKFGAVLGSNPPHALQGEPEVVLRHIATQILSKLAVDQQFTSFMRLIVGESGRFPALARAYVENIAKPAITLLTEYFAACPTLKLVDAEATARLVIGTLVYFIILQKLMHGDTILPMDSDRLISNMIDLITRQPQS
jgi:AcrR family transcriptional regulator